MWTMMTWEVSFGTQCMLVTLFSCWRFTNCYCLLQNNFQFSFIVRCLHGKICLL